MAQAFGEVQDSLAVASLSRPQEMMMIPIFLWAGLVALILGLAVWSPPALLQVAALAALLIIVSGLSR